MTVSVAELLDRDPAKLASELVASAQRAGSEAWIEGLGEALDRHRARAGLGRVLAIWRLGQAEAAGLFGVSRQAVNKWLARGVPTDRLEAVADLAAATDLLVRHLERERIPAVVRRRAARLGGQSLLELVGSGQSREVLAACRAMFAFGEAHG